MCSGTYLFRLLAQLYELLHFYGVICSRSTHRQRKFRLQDGVDLPFDMSRLTTGRSALDPLQRSCGTKVRRVAACRRTLPQTGCVEI